MTEGPVREGYVKGLLTQIPFPKVLNFINQAGKTGILALSQGKRKVHIHFDRGEIVYATSSYLPEMSLGDYLVKDGKITREVHEAAVEAARTGKVKLGAYLVEKGHLSPHDLYEVLNKQVTRKLFKLFALTDGEFYFREGEIIGEEHRILTISFPNLLYRGIRKYMPLNRPPTEFRGRKEYRLVKRMAGRYRIEDLKLAPSDVRIFNAINGERTVRQVVAASQLNARIAYKVLYALFLLELIGFPEASRGDQLQRDTKKKRDVKPTSDGYEIQVSGDLLAEAMASVDRIKREVDRPGGEHDLAHDLLSRVDAHIAAGRRATPAPERIVPERMAPEPTAPEEEPADEVAEDEDFGADFAVDEPAEQDGFPQDETPTDPFRHVRLEDEVAPPAEATDEMGFDVAEEGAEEAEASPFMTDIEDYSNPEDLIKQARYMLDDAKWSAARQFLEKAIALDENQADAYALLGWAIFNETDMPGRDIEAEKTIKRGLKIAPNRHLHFLYLGKIYAGMHQKEFAELHFVKALELNVECSEAKEEIKKLHRQ